MPKFRPDKNVKYASNNGFNQSDFASKWSDTYSANEVRSKGRQLAGTLEDYIDDNGKIISEHFGNEKHRDKQGTFATAPHSSTGGIQVTIFESRSKDIIGEFTV